MQRGYECFGVRVVFRLLVLLCLSLFSVMSVFGNGPPRTARYAMAAQATSVLQSGIRVLPAPERVVKVDAAPKPAATIPVVPVLALAQGNDRPLLVEDRPQVEDLADALPANLQLRWITARTANVRAEPNKRSALAGKIGLGGAVHVMWAEPNGWVRVRSAAGDVSGFVHKSLLTETAPPAATLDLATAD